MTTFKGVPFHGEFGVCASLGQEKDVSKKNDGKVHVALMTEAIELSE
jgi:hypothetical protein